ncbi:DUF4238 domain-containing protein [Microcoleus sp.]|uniref:DUF4238 domain-containing protein n=1 Tax=Microcoleus sp. TaxID=44472 RepID=UPI0035269EC6
MKNHFVPQLLLDYWNCGKKKGKEKINVFDKNKMEVRRNQTISEVFFGNNILRDPVEKKIFAEIIEGSAATVVKKIVTGDFNIISEDLSTLHTFIWSLYNRTLASSKIANECGNSSWKLIAQKALCLNGLNPAEASSLEFIFKDDNALSENIINVLPLAKILGDLEYHIIKNETSSEFYISDHPVFIYNWFYRDLEHRQVISITATGLQIFLPLSPKITLCLYDPKVYKYGNKSSVTCISNNSDIEILNSFQVINSNSIIGFSLIESELNIKQLYEKYKNIKLHQPESRILSTNNEDKGKIISMQLHQIIRQHKLEKMPSFIKIKKRAKGGVSFYQERNPELAAKYIEYAKFIKMRRQRSIIELD